MYLKDAKEAAQQNVTPFLYFFYIKVKHTSRYDVTVHLQYDVNCSFKFYLHYSFTPDQFLNIFMWLSFPTGDLYISVRLKVMHLYNAGNFLSDKCNLSFYVQYMNIYTCLCFLFNPLFANGPLLGHQ